MMSYRQESEFVQAIVSQMMKTRNSISEMRALTSETQQRIVLSRALLARLREKYPEPPPVSPEE